MHEPAAVVLRGLARLRRRFLMHALADALAMGAIAASLASFAISAWIATSIGVLVLAVVATWSWRRWTRQRTALAVDAQLPASHNLLVTSEEALAGRRVHPVIARELFAQAAVALEHLRQPPRVTATRWIVSAGIVAASLVVVSRSATSRTNVVSQAANAFADVIRVEPRLRITVTPPSYTKRERTTLENPFQIRVLEGSTVDLHVTGDRGRVELIEPGHDPVPFSSRDDGAHLEFVVTRSRVLLVRSTMDRLLQVHVESDKRPVVSIERPGRDLIFSSAEGTVSVVIKAEDDLNVSSISLRYIRISGGGETFTFQEGEIHLTPVSNPDSKSRQATVTLNLKDLNLADGDALVYRGIARDEKPGADPGVSDSFLVEIGKRSEASSAGFAVPDDRDRQALSQQMLIMKTERLHANRQRLSAETLLEQSRLLAVEQRMVRAEFLFMTGGEVVDEVEEAEHSDELAQGRFENRGQIELLTAIREMSRAHARLNAADTSQALVFERAALAALQRAFDRRRYFLRTLPERARIDPSRRLTGDLAAAQSSTRAVLPAADDPAVTTVVRALADLSTAITTRSRLDAQLAARLLAIDPEARPLQQSAAQLSAPRTLDERLAAARAAQRHLGEWLRQHLGPAPLHRIPREPLAGALVDQLQRTEVPR